MKAYERRTKENNKKIHFVLGKFRCYCFFFHRAFLFLFPLRWCFYWFLIFFCFPQIFSFNHETSCLFTYCILFFVSRWEIHLTQCCYKIIQDTFSVFFINFSCVLSVDIMAADGFDVRGRKFTVKHNSSLGDGLVWWIHRSIGENLFFSFLAVKVNGLKFVRRTVDNFSM